jgi:hypothetical protein
LTSVSKKLNEFKTLTLGSGENQFNFYKVGNIVMCTNGGLGNLNAGYTNLGTIADSDFIPKISVQVGSIQQGNYGAPVAIFIQPNGNITCYNYGSAVPASANVLLRCFTYIVA